MRCFLDSSEQSEKPDMNKMRRMDRMAGCDSVNMGIDLAQVGSEGHFFWAMKRAGMLNDFGIRQWLAAHSLLHYPKEKFAATA